MGHTFKDDKHKQDGGRTQALRLAQTLEEHLAMVEGEDIRAFHASPRRPHGGPLTRAIMAEAISAFLETR
jgi:hypothetical protein